MRRRCCHEMSDLNAGGVVKVCRAGQGVQSSAACQVGATPCVASSWGTADDESASTRSHGITWVPTSHRCTARLTEGRQRVYQ